MKKDSKAKIARKYAEALYLSAEDKKSTKSVFQDIEKVLHIIDVEKDFIKSFANPIWGDDSKKEAMQKIAKKIGLGKETLGCLNLILDNNRVNDLKAILQEFRSIFYVKHGVVEIGVHTVIALSASQDKALQANLEKILKKKVVVNYKIAPEILGGLMIEYESNMIDDSVLGKLNRLETVMKGGQ